MPVHALELHRPAVDEEGVAVYPLLLDADLLRADVAALLYDERVEIRLLGGPETGVLQGCRLGVFQGRVGVAGGAERAHLYLVGVEKLRRPVAVDSADREDGVPVVVEKPGLHHEVPDAVLRLRPERHIAEDARESEHVLILQIAAVAPLEDLDGEDVRLAGLVEVRRDVELARKLRVLGVADGLPVDPDVEGGPHALEAQYHVASGPPLGDGELPPVAGDGVVVGPACVAVEYLRPLVRVGIADVGVAWRTVSAHLHAARDVDLLPARDVVLGALEALRTPRGVADPLDAPLAVQRHGVRRRRLEVVRQGGRLVRQRDGVRARRQPVYGIDRCVLPVVRPLRGDRRGRGEGQRRHRLDLHLQLLLESTKTVFTSRSFAIARASAETPKVSVS